LQVNNTYTRPGAHLLQTYIVLVIDGALAAVRERVGREKVIRNPANLEHMFILF
jgi:hypothetical protein